MFALNPEDDCQMKFNRALSKAKPGLKITFRYCCLKTASVTQLQSLKLTFRGQKPGITFRTRKDISLLASDSHRESQAQSHCFQEFQPASATAYNGNASPVLTPYCFGYATSAVV